MLKDIYLEYSEDIFDYLLSKINNITDGHQIIETLVKGYYTYIQENTEIFHFVDQFSNCPALVNQCSQRKGISNLNNLLDRMKEKRIFKDFRNDNLIAIIFSPIKYIAINKCIGEIEQADLVEEMISIIQDTLLV